MQSPTLEAAAGVLPALSVPGTVLLRGPVGSTVYGLAHAGSDVDFLGCYAAPTRDVLGLGARWLVAHTDLSTDPDQQLHEVGKLLALVLDANPTATELLWLPSYETRHPAAEPLLAMRERFASTTRVRDAYGGYAVQQARKLLSRHAEGKLGFGTVPANRVRKHGRHCFRLMVQGHELLTTGHLTLDLGERREEAFAFGDLAATDPAAFEVAFTDMLRQLTEATSVLPEEPDRDAAEQVLTDLRVALLT